MARALPGERPLALERVWVDAAPGHARIAEFALVADAPSGAAEAMGAEHWPRFLHQATLFGLEGRVVPEVDLRPGVTRAPFPEHARALLSRLCGEGPPVESPEALVQELELLRRRPAGVTRRQRLFTFLVPVAAPLLAMALGLAVRGMLNLSPAWVEILQTETRVEALKKIEGTDPRSVERREAIRMLLAASYAQAQTQRSLRDSLRYMPEKTRRLLEAAAHDYPSLTPEQVEDARRRAGLKDVSIRSGENSNITVQMDDKVPPGEAGRKLLGAWMCMGVAAVALTPFFGSGLLLYLSGITLQRNDGGKAGWTRCVLRSLVAWAPLLACLLRLRQPLGPVDLVLFGLAAAGTIYAVIHPQRGLPDLVAGTRLVPR
jgi:hypothetical protein